MKKDLLKFIVKQVNDLGEMTDYKKDILRDVAIIVDTKKNGWIGYKVIGKNGYGFNYFYKKEE